MKFQVLLAFVVVIVYCQAQPQLGDSDTSPVNKVQKSGQQGRSCKCTGSIGQKQKCPCVLHPEYASPSKELNAKKRKPQQRKCQQLISRRNRKEHKGISIPI